MSFLDIMLLPFVACVVLVGIHAYMGMHILERGVIFVDLALAQLAALGAAAGTLFGFEIGTLESFACALMLTLLGAAFLSLTRVRNAPVPQEASIGLIYVVASAAVILVLDQTPRGEEHIKSLLTGSVLWVARDDIIIETVVYASIGVLHYILRDKFLLISHNPDEARAAGQSLLLWDFIFYATFGLVVTLSVAVAGVLLVFTFLIGAPMMAFLLARTFRARLILAWSLGVVLSIVGLSLSYQFDLPTGAAVVCVFGVAIALAGAARRLLGVHLSEPDPS